MGAALVAADTFVVTVVLTVLKFRHILFCFLLLSELGTDCQPFLLIGMLHYILKSGKAATLSVRDMLPLFTLLGQAVSISSPLEATLYILTLEQTASLTCLRQAGSVSSHWDRLPL
jgi:hypothetical protein